jgi:hypothetical protein
VSRARREEEDLQTHGEESVLLAVLSYIHLAYWWLFGRGSGMARLEPDGPRRDGEAVELSHLRARRRGEGLQMSRKILGARCGGPGPRQWCTRGQVGRTVIEGGLMTIPCESKKARNAKRGSF